MALAGGGAGRADAVSRHGGHAAPGVAGGV
jgi:hypothetical protein